MQQIFPLILKLMVQSSQLKYIAIIPLKLCVTQKESLLKESMYIGPMLGVVKVPYTKHSQNPLSKLFHFNLMRLVTLMNHILLLQTRTLYSFQEVLTIISLTRISPIFTWWSRIMLIGTIMSALILSTNLKQYYPISIQWFW